MKQNEIDFSHQFVPRQSYASKIDENEILSSQPGQIVMKEVFKKVHDKIVNQNCAGEGLDEIFKH